jgi:hypothetical protein
VTNATGKVIRSLCFFAGAAGEQPSDPEMRDLAARLESRGYLLQTQRLCFGNATIGELGELDDGQRYLSLGTVSLSRAIAHFDDFVASGNVAFNVAADGEIGADAVDFLVRLIREAPAKTFLFAFTFGNRPASPYFPSATYERPGFAVGLQPTDLAAGCESLDAWFGAMAEVWIEICDIFGDRKDFLGIDSSVAPLFRGDSSLVHLVRRLHGSFSKAVCSDVFMTISEFIRECNPRPVGLCGLMLPCLEDFVLAEEYERGEFSLERNLFLSLHCGLGVDTYPVGLDEEPERILQVLRLLRRLSLRYDKPLSARFVSDGRARIGQMTHFGNRYLKDVVVRPLVV